MDNKDNREDREAAALKCWEQAVQHAEKADAILEELIQLYNDGMTLINHNRMMASVYLAAGGFGNDPQAYNELGLPYDKPEED